MFITQLFDGGTIFSRWVQDTRLPSWQTHQSCPVLRWRRSITPLWLMERSHLFFFPKRNVHVVLIDPQSIKGLINWCLMLIYCVVGGRWSRTGLSKVVRWRSKPLRPRRPHRLSPPWPKPPSQQAKRFSPGPQSRWLSTGEEVPAQSTVRKSSCKTFTWSII